MKTIGITDSSLVTASLPGELSPLERAIMDGCNSVHEARALGDDHSLIALREHLDHLLSQYDETDGEDHPNPAWARATQRALVFSAFGHVDQAIRLERVALKYADTPRRREISLGNLAERFLRTEHYEEAVTCFLDAHEVAPHSVPVMLTGAQALYAAGFNEEANRIFESFEARPELMSDDTELGAYLEYERRLDDMAHDLPALARLLARWQARAQA